MASQIQLIVQNLPKTRRLRRMRPARFPRAIERRFVAENRDLVRAQYDLVNELLLPRLGEIARLAGIREDAARLDQSPWRALLRQIMSDARQRYQAAFGPAAQNAEDIAREMSLFSRQEIARQMRQVVGVDIFSENAELVDLLEQFTEDNVSRITTTSAANFDQIERVVSQGFRSGQRASTVGDAIVGALGVAETRAAFWARDQIGTLNGQLAKQRQEALGLEEYIWRTSRDELVRKTHRQLEGTKQRWDSPPTVGAREVHPGEDYNCRCTPDPVIPGVDNVETSPADVPRDPDLVKRKRAADRRRRENKRRREAGLLPIVRTGPRRARAPREIPTTGAPKTIRLPRSGRRVNLSADQVRRSDVAKALTSGAARAQATPGQRIDRLMWSWVHGSRRKTSIEMKQAAIREFKLRGTAYNPMRHRPAEVDVRQSAKDLRRMFNATQRHLAEQGRQSVKVYRGIKGEVGTRGAVESWTTSRATAQRFAGTGGRVLAETVPAERILAIQNGPNWLDGAWGDQSEVVVLF